MVLCFWQSYEIRFSLILRVVFETLSHITIYCQRLTHLLWWRHNWRLSKATRPVLPALLSCQCNDFVALQLINVEVIKVCVSCVVIIENTMSKKERYQMFYHLLVLCWQLCLSCCPRLVPLSLINNKSFVRCYFCCMIDIGLDDSRSLFFGWSSGG